LKNTPDIDTIYRDIYVKPGEQAAKLAMQYGYLPYMVQRYIYMIGYSETKALLDAFEKPLKPVIRTNTLKIDGDKLYRRLEDLGYVLEPVKWAPYSYRVVEEPDSPSIGATHEYLKGLYYVHRDAASLIPGILLTHEYSGEVLDLCAAPGGKATHMAQLLEDKHVVWANDLVLYRLRSLVSHVMRMGFRNIRVIWSDARKTYRLLNKRFTRVLLDAPCSGEGTIMLDPGRKTRTRLIDLARIVKREIELLYYAFEILEKDGILTYVTCSIAPEENEYVIAKLIELRNDVEVIDPPLKLLDHSSWITTYHKHRFPNELRRCIRIWPHKHGLIGFTTCLLRKTR